MADLGRRGLFGAIGAAATNKQTPVRPPYAADFSLFGTLCPACEGMCGTACEEAIIKFDDRHLPYLDFSQSGCTDCEACLEACTPGVLCDKMQPIPATVRINPVKCMSWHDVMCFSCKEPCLDNAIAFKGLFKPEIDTARCTACGFCIARCPSDAIEIFAT